MRSLLTRLVSCPSPFLQNIFGWYKPTESCKPQPCVQGPKIKPIGKIPSGELKRSAFSLQDATAADCPHVWACWPPRLAQLPFRLPPPLPAA